MAETEFDLGPFLRIEAKITKDEHHAIRQRWEYGQKLLAERGDKKQLPNGLREKLTETTGVERSEIGRRMLFAERYPTEAQVAHACATYGSWHRLVKEGLREKIPPAETPPLPEGRFRCIVADPPWQQDTGPGFDPDHPGHKPLAYPPMELEAIEALEVEDHSADDAHLYLWTTNKYLRQAYDVAEAWGFRPSVPLVWAKAPLGMGLGDTYRLTTEFVLFARRGKLKHQRYESRSWFDWPRGKHSEKPAAFFEMAKAVTPGPYLEMFARGPRKGWKVWGAEANGSL